MYELVWQGGDTPLQPVLRAATAVKILTEKFYNGIAYTYYAIVVLLLKFRLTLPDQLSLTIYIIKEI